MLVNAIVDVLLQLPINVDTPGWHLIMISVDTVVVGATIHGQSL